MTKTDWDRQKATGRDEVLLDIERRAFAYSAEVVQDIRNVMHDYEVDMYRLVLSVGKRYGMDTAYEIMSDTVSAKRLKWLDQRLPGLNLQGTEIEQGLEIYTKYFRCKEENFRLIEETREFVIFQRKDFIDAIAHACDVLALDVIEVNNKVYARSMNKMFAQAGLHLRNEFVKREDDWYTEKISLDK